MSTIPPNVPPIPPPYDPRQQYRAYRDQQKAAWRAQKDQWRAQSYAWKAQYAGIPRVPSLVGPVLLITIGVVALLITAGFFHASNFFSWYADWWPIVLIGAGVALLVEWAIDLRSQKTHIRKGGFIGLIILLAILGIFASGWKHVASPLHDQFAKDDDLNSFFNGFGFDQREHAQEFDVTNTTLPANAVIEVQNPHGDVSISASEGNAFTIKAHTVIMGGEDAEANAHFKELLPHVNITGGSVQIRGDEKDHGSADLTITVPKGAKLIVNAGHGDVTIADTTGGLNITQGHGDTHINNITGLVEARLSPKGEFSAHQITGDVTTTGECHDVTLTEIKGKATLNCGSVGDLHFENISGAVHVDSHSSDISAESLPGDLTLNEDALNITEAHGQLNVKTHSRNVELNEIYGNTSVENRDGSISVELAGNYNVDAKNEKGDVEVTLPLNASAQVDGTSHNGQIETDFNLPVSGEETKTVKGTIGGGATKLTLLARNGDLNIKHGGAIPAPPKPPRTPDVPSPNAPHLKAPQGTTVKPVAQ
jgi:DUF4097 and DUF4098 domain-containing protein YvlB